MGRCGGPRCLWPEWERFWKMSRGGLSFCLALPGCRADAPRPVGTRRRPLGGALDTASCGPSLLRPDSEHTCFPAGRRPVGQADPEGTDLLTAGPNPTRGALCGGRRWVGSQQTRSLRCPGGPCPWLAGRPRSGGPPLHQPARVTGGRPLNLSQFIFSAPHPWSYTTTLPAHECGGVLKNYLPPALI